jgi:apolipoprotein N-acyltransferase
MPIRWYLLPLLTALLTSLIPPPFSQSAFNWVCLVPLLLFLDRAPTKRAAFAGGLLAGTTYTLLFLWPFTTLIWWGWASNPTEYAAVLSKQDTFIASFYPLLSLSGGLFWALWAALLVGLVPSRRDRVWFAAAAWMVFEYLRALALFEYTIGFLGYGLYPYQTLRQLAAITGTLGLSGLVVLVNAAIAHAFPLVLAAVRGERVDRIRAEVAVVVSVAIAFAACLGLAHAYENHDEPAGQAKRVNVAALQAGKSTYTREDFQSGSLDHAYLPLLEKALDGGAEILLLPESVWLAKLKLDDTEMAHTISKQVSEDEILSFLGPRLSNSGAIALVGIDVAAEGQAYNAIVAWDSSGILGRYHKRWLTPFAEYSPWLWKWTAPEGRVVYTAGEGSQLFDLNGIRVGGFICQEAQFPELTRRSVLDGAEILVTNGNDSIFRDPRVAYWHHVATQFRAIETHRPIVRAMKTGISSVVNAHGQLAAHSQMGASTGLLATVPISQVTTPYVRWGNWLVYLALIYIVAVGFLRIRRGGS